MKKVCRTCGLANKEKRVCLLKGIPIELDTDFCSKHTGLPMHCEICGSIVLTDHSILDYDGENYHLVCHNCNNALKTCQACSKFQICPFETDPNPLPKMVNQQFKQGNMVMQTMIKNNERIKVLCPSCECWNEEIGCLKEYNIGCIKQPSFWLSCKS